MLKIGHHFIPFVHLGSKNVACVTQICFEQNNTHHVNIRMVSRIMISDKSMKIQPAFE